MASATVELNQQRSDSSLATKPTRSHAPMDAIPLNNPTGEKHNEITVKCNHFSIRGYVSEVRKKDPKLCYPFSLKDSTEPSCIELPPMVVPKFRWWQCISCVPEARASWDADGKAAQKPDETADAPLPPVGQSSKVNEPRVRNAEASTSIDSNDNRNYPPSNVFVDPKGKGKAHVEDEPAPASAWENGILMESSQGILQQTTGGIEFSLAAGNKAAELGSRGNGNGIVKALQKDSRVDGIEAGPAQEYVNHNGEYAKENCQGKQQASTEDRHAASPTKGMRTEVAGFVNEPRNGSKSRLINLPDLNECSGEPLYDENNEAMINNSSNDAFCEDDDDYLGAERRKYPKVRLLSDLLGLKETQISAKGKRKNPSLTNSLDENVKRKRLGSQDEGSKSMEIKYSNSNTKKINGNAEISESYSESASESDDVSMEIISKALEKRRCKSKVPLLEKRSKKSKFDNSGPSMSRQKVMSKSAGHDEVKTSENLPRKSDYPDQLIERSSVLTKKRGRVLQTAKETTAFTPCESCMPIGYENTPKDDNAEKSLTQNVQKAPENVHHFPRSYVIKRNCQVRAPPVEDGLCLPSSEAESMLVDCTSVRKHQGDGNNVRETSVGFRPSAVVTPFTGNPFDANGERSICAKTLKEMKTGIHEAEEGSPLACDKRLQASNSVVDRKELNKAVRGRVNDIDINSIPTDDKGTEQGIADDIPMDIVELMAKNQYERHMSDPKDKHNYPAPPDIAGKRIRDNGIDGSYGDWQKFGQPHFLSMQKPPATDARNCMVNGNLGHFSDFNRNSLNVTGCLHRENPVSARYFSPTQGQEHGHTPPYPPCGLAQNNWNSSFNMVAAQRYPPNVLQAVESYRLRAYAPRQNTAEASHVWPSVVASRMPLGITNPQMISQSSSLLSKGKIHHQTSGSILNFNTSAPSGLGKPQNLNFSNGYNVGGHSESSAGSVDVYANDAISAMHLLSLMQNAAKMQNAALSLGPQKVMAPTSSRQPFVDNNGRASAMQDNSRHPCYPTAIPAARPFASSFQSEGANLGRSINTGFVGPIPLTLRGQRNIESSHFALQGGNHRPQRRQMGSSLEKGKDISAISDPSYVNPLQGMKDAAPNFLCGGGVKRDDRIISPISEKITCKLNQNPSEFNDLKVLSRFMIGPDDLRPRGMARERSSRPRGDTKKHDFRLNKPIPSVKEREKQRKS